MLRGFAASLSFERNDLETLGDSCLWGTRSVEVAQDCVWQLHGGGIGNGWR